MRQNSYLTLKLPAMEDVCPVAKKKSLKSCPVFTKHNMSHLNYGNINSLTNLKAFTNTVDVPLNTINSNNVLENLSFDDEINEELNEKEYLESHYIYSNVSYSLCCFALSR